MATIPGPDYWVILISPKDAGHDVRAVSRRWPARKTTALPRLMRRFPCPEAAASWLNLAVDPGARHRYAVVEERLKEYPARVAGEVRTAISEVRLKAEREAEREAKRAAKSVPRPSGPAKKRRPGRKAAAQA